MSLFSSQPIPTLKSAAGWKTLPIKECGEPLVPIGPLSGYPQIFQDSIYYGEGETSPYKRGELEGALLTMFMRKSLADRLAEAAKLLPGGCAFLVLDAYRPLTVQKALYDDYYGQLIGKKGLPPDQAAVAAQKFISIPSSDPACPSPHSTGGSVDLTIVRTGAGIEALPMGTTFDEVSDKTATRYYEEKTNLTDLEKEYLKNRRLLVNVLSAVGISNYEEEWWHFDFGNQFHAKRTGEDAVYGAAVFSKENQSWEEMRRKKPAEKISWKNCPEKASRLTVT